MPDDLDKLRDGVRRGAAAATWCCCRGGTSKGAGDLSYRVVGEFGPPGVVAHGVALKPGKPLCLAVVDLRSARRAGPCRPFPVAVLPGFPTSAIFTFHEFVAPVLRELAGRPAEPPARSTATLPLRVNSERGRTEYVLVGLVRSAGSRRRLARARSPSRWARAPGPVTAFGRADGFVTIPRQREYLEAGEAVEVRLLGAGLRPADLVVIGSHCLGLDYLLGRLRDRGLRGEVPGGRQHRRAGGGRSAASATWPASTCSTRRPTSTTARS